MNDGWKLSGRIELETLFHFNEAYTAHLRAKPILLEIMKMPIHREISDAIAGLKQLKTVTLAEAMAIGLRQRDEKLREGMDIDRACYHLAFERMSDDDKARLVKLYPDVRTEREWLEDEAFVAGIIGDKRKLDNAAKHKLARLAGERVHGASVIWCPLSTYFACFPLADVARHFLEKRGIEIAGDSDEGGPSCTNVQRAADDFAHKHGMTVAKIVEGGFTDWYEAVGAEAHVPLAMGDEHGLIGRWVAAKEAARREIEQLIESGTLRVRKATQEDARYERIPVGDRMITGESLYGLAPGRYAFADEFKERVDRYDPNLGLVYDEDDPDRKGKHLDQELLISKTDKNGEPHFFSMYGRALMRLEAFDKALLTMKVERGDDYLILHFPNADIEKMFYECRETFVTAYGKLLAARDALNRLSPVYGCELTERMDELLTQLNGCVKTHNDALDLVRIPAQTIFDDGKEKVLNECSVDPSLYIDTAALAPDAETMKDCNERIKEALGNMEAYL
jgi:hypothetical protein